MKAMTDINVKELQQNVEAADKKDSLIERENIEDSPFTIVSIEEEHFGVMGEYRLTEKYSNKEELKKELSKITWNRIIQIVMVLDEVKQKLNLKSEEK
tara:strand:- start:712 stop:1005 length:294 start_codon:yes stop_codon:yes gene_type:complete